MATNHFTLEDQIDDEIQTEYIKSKNNTGFDLHVPEIKKAIIELSVHEDNFFKILINIQQYINIKRNAIESTILNTTDKIRKLAYNPNNRDENCDKIRQIIKRIHNIAVTWYAYKSITYEQTENIVRELLHERHKDNFETKNIINFVSERIENLYDRITKFHSTIGGIEMVQFYKSMLQNFSEVMTEPNFKKLSKKAYLRMKQEEQTQEGIKIGKFYVACSLFTNKFTNDTMGICKPTPVNYLSIVSEIHQLVYNITRARINSSEYIDVIQIIRECKVLRQFRSFQKINSGNYKVTCRECVRMYERFNDKNCPEALCLLYIITCASFVQMEICNEQNILFKF